MCLCAWFCACVGGYHGPSAAEKWPITAERAKFDLGCNNLNHTVLAGGEPRTVSDPYPRVYYEYAVSGCGKRAVYRVLFSRGTQDEVQNVSQ